MYLHQQKGFTIKYLKFDILLSIELYFRKSFNNFSAELPLFSLWTVGSWRLWNQSLKYKYFRIFSYRDRPTHFIREKEKKYFHHRYVTNLHNSNRFSTTMTNIFYFIFNSFHVPDPGFSQCRNPDRCNGIFCRCRVFWSVIKWDIFYLHFCRTKREVARQVGVLTTEADVRTVRSSNKMTHDHPLTSDLNV